MSAITSQQLSQQDICIYVEGQSKLDDIAKRQLNKREKLMYKTILQLQNHPSAINGNLAYVKINVSIPNNAFYLQLDTSSAIITTIRVTRRGFTKPDNLTDGQLNKILQNIKKTADTIQIVRTETPFRTKEGIKKRNFTTTKTVPANYFTVRDLL